MTEVERGVRSVVRDITARDVSSLQPDDDLVMAVGIDSLQGLQILAIVEKRFDVRLRDEELIQMRTIGRIAQAIEAAGSKRGTWVLERSERAGAGAGFSRPGRRS